MVSKITFHKIDIYRVEMERYDGVQSKNQHKVGKLETNDINNNHKKILTKRNN